MPPSPAQRAVYPSHHATHLLILNKSDLGEHATWKAADAIRISCINQDGFDQLSEKIRSALHFSEADFGEHAVAINARHKASLSLARTNLLAALELLDEANSDPELAAIDLREALDALEKSLEKSILKTYLVSFFPSFVLENDCIQQPATPLDSPNRIART